MTLPVVAMHPILELRCSSPKSHFWEGVLIVSVMATSANERTNDGTDDDLNDGSNAAPAFADGANCTHEPNMSPHV